MRKLLEEAIGLLEDEAKKLEKWTKDMEDGGWSTWHVKPMRRRAALLRNKTNELKVKMNGL